jgi:hypothetical protein
MKEKDSNISIGSISNSSGGQVNIAAGNIYQENNFSDNNYGSDSQDVIKLFDHIFAQIDVKHNLSSQMKADLKADVKDIQQEIKKGKKADNEFIARRLRNIKRMAPEILEVVVATIVNPVFGLSVAAKKVAEKIKATA